MPGADFRLFVDNQQVDDAQLAAFSRIRVEQAIGLATAAELEVVIATGADGTWVGFDDPWLRPLARLRVEVRVGSGDYVALIDGPAVGQRFVLDAAPETSRVVVVVHDDSVLLDRDERVKVFENEPLARLIAGLIDDAGLDADVDPSLPDAASSLDRYIVQRGSSMQLLKTLARRHGMQVRVEPGSAPGRSTVVFGPTAPVDDGLPEIVLLGDQRNIAIFSAEYDALKAQAPRAASVQAIDRQTITASAAGARTAAMGDEAVHTLAAPATTLLAHHREEQSDIDEATAGVADVSAWAFTASGEVDSDLYPAVLRAWRRLAVAGAGPQLSGDYVVSRVLHEIDDAAYRQRFSLSRNARSADGGGVGAAPAGVF